VKTHKSKTEFFENINLINCEGKTGGAKEEEKRVDNPSPPAGKPRKP
jgi:hypothetical protein